MRWARDDTESRALSVRVARDEMRRRVRAFDWAATPLGPPEVWPASLGLSVEIVLSSGFPMAVRWGSDLIMIYNDAYAPLLEGRHPRAFGRPTRECWPEIIDDLGPLSQSILRGERGGFFAQDHLWHLKRQGVPEDAYFTASYSPIPDAGAQNGIGGILVTVVETTARVHNEKTLRVLTDRLEAEVEQRTRERDRIWMVSEDLFGVSNFAGYFTSINPAWTRLLGWSEAEIKRMHVSELRHPDDASAAEVDRARLAADVSTVRMENRFRHRDGSWRWIAWTMTAEDGQIYVAGRHVTAEKEMREALNRTQMQLAQAQKMEALGELTGGVAHDFNNLLMIVSGNAQSLARRLPDAKDKRALDAIQSAAARGEALTRQLLTFSRRQPLNPRTVCPAQTIAGFRDVLASSAPGNIEFSVEIEEEIWPISIDISEFELALVNLVVNARDAMPERGSIVVSATNCALYGDETPERLSGDFVAVTVADTGAGIPADIMSKIFEPFFTTKTAGKGTGLGLSQAYGFAHQSGGSLIVESEVGRGTKVKMYLPRSLDAVVLAAGEMPSGKAGNGERILVVEDNPDVKTVAVNLLKQLNYRTHAVDNARAALDVLRKEKGIDLLFTDVMLPGDMDGLALAREVRARYPELPVLLTSGYAKALTARHGLPILRKPYRIAALGEEIRKNLDAAHKHSI